MDDSLCIGNLPDWRYAGKRDDSVIANARLEEKGQKIAIFLHASPKNVDKVIKREYFVESGYLIPRYNVQEHDYRRREEELLIDRVQRFFYSCEPGLDIVRTGQQIKDEIALFDSKLSEIRNARQEQGLPEFNFSTPYHDMNGEERQLLAEGSQIVGHAVNRLGRLGRIILQGNHDGVKYEHDNAYIKRHIEVIKAEFTDLWIKIAFTDKDIVRCVLTRDGKPDHDGVFADLIREIGKPLRSVIGGEALSRTATPDAETESRKNIVTKIGYTLEAIDEVAEAMAQISQHPNFSRLLKQAASKQEKPQERASGIPNDLSPSNYRGLLREYIEISRARACIKSDDADNFNPVAARMRFLQNELGLHHEALFKSTQYEIMGKSYHDENSARAITMLKRGVALMGEMAELRMPRNCRALDVYDRESPEFKNRDASSVGRYKEDIVKFLEVIKQSSKAVRFPAFGTEYNRSGYAR